MVDLHILLERHRGEVKLLRHDEYLLQRLRLAKLGLDAIESDSARLGAQQTANQIKQSRFASSVLAQQTVDVVLFQLQTEIIEYQILLTCVLKTDVFYLNHILLNLMVYSSVIVYHFDSTLQK